jgi:hypothetical protein
MVKVNQLKSAKIYLQIDNIFKYAPITFVDVEKSFLR